MTENTTVCALSTPRGKGGIAVIRISGEKALEITEKTVKSRIKTLYEHPRRTPFFHTKT